MNYMSSNVGMRPGVQLHHVRKAKVMECNKGEQMNSLPKFKDFLKTALQVSSLVFSQLPKRGCHVQLGLEKEERMTPTQKITVSELVKPSYSHMVVIQAAEQGVNGKMTKGQGGNAFLQGRTVRGHLGFCYLKFNEILRCLLCEPISSHQKMESCTNIFLRGVIL